MALETASYTEGEEEVEEEEEEGCTVYLTPPQSLPRIISLLNLINILILILTSSPYRMFTDPGSEKRMMRADRNASP